MPTSEVASIWSHDRNRQPPGVVQAVVRGSLGFAVVSVAAFSVWALGGKSLEARIGEVGLYCACGMVFIGASGFFLASLVKGPNSLGRFYAVFIPAFLAYAIAWCAAWFMLHFGPGEWLGSLIGTIAFASMVAWRFGNHSGLLKTISIVFGCHTAGYFLGGRLMYWLTVHGPAVMAGFSKHQIGVAARLSWGLLYGLGFGSGIGYTFHKLQPVDVTHSYVAKGK